MNTIRRIVFSPALVCLSMAGNNYAAQSDVERYPRKPVTIVVPFSPGGATDLTARVLAPALSEAMGQPFIVDNRTGAGGRMALELVARAEPDGHTILVGNVSISSITPVLLASTLSFKPEKELTGITLLASVPSLLVSGTQFPAKDLKGLVAYAKTRPGKLNYAMAFGGYSHLDILDFNKRAGVSMEGVPGRGAGAWAASIVSGEIDLGIMNAASSAPLVKAGRMRAYATTAQKRIPDLPDVPTMAEAGYPGVGSDNWNGFFVPARTPRAIVNKLFNTVVPILQRKEIQTMFENRMIQVVYNKSPEDFDAFVRDEMNRWARIIRENDLDKLKQ